MKPINQSTILTGEKVKLIPLEEKYFNELEVLAGDPRIWEYITFDMSNSEKCKYEFSKAIKERENGNQFPFVIFHKKENKVIGSTRLMNIEPANRKLEIGWTWLHPNYWGTSLNEECKFLLLTFCFEELGAIRVQLKTDVNNIRSRKAIAKIGGQYEGILRNDCIRANGTFRDSVYFSIINSEWEITKTKLSKLLLKK
jgi:RimJ/RimL family protein N-acetyltransferase